MFKYSYSDHSLFILSQGEVVINILVCIDDLTISGNDSEAIRRFKTYLSKYFHMKDLGGSLAGLLGVKPIGVPL